MDLFEAQMKFWCSQSSREQSDRLGPGAMVATRPPESTGSGILYPRHIVKKSDLAGTFERKSRYMLSRKCPQQLFHLLSVSRHNNSQTIQILPVNFLALQHPSGTITSLIVPRILEALQKAQFSRILAGTFRLQHLDPRHKINFRRPCGWPRRP